VLLKGRLGYDDALDAFGVHGVGGILGSVLLGVFASKAWNGAGQDGLLFGEADLLIANLKGTAVGCLWAAVATFVLLKLVQRVTGLRVDEETEGEGLDQSIHGEKGYADPSGSHLPV
jgi:Amt family ammonium transporter